MSRRKALVALMITAILALAGVAAAALAAKPAAKPRTIARVTGGTTTITASSTTTGLLTSYGIKLKALAPASASGSTITFPIAGGRLNTKTFHGRIRNTGGILFSHGKVKIVLRAPTIISNARGVSLWALARGPKGGLHIVRIARITNASKSGGIGTGTLTLTATSAAVINRLAGKPIVTVGTAFGTGTIKPTLG